MFLSTLFQERLCRRSAMPVAVAMLSALIEHKIPTLTEVAALAVLSIGVMIAVWEGSVTGSVTGLVLCVAALFSNAAMISTTGKVRRQAFHFGQAVLQLQGLCRFCTPP